MEEKLACNHFLSSNNSPFSVNSSVLAIGIDAAEPTLVRQMIEQDELPALGSLLRDGKWLAVRSPAPIGSASVWPTFLTGADPIAHGIYSEWRWLPETMRLRRYDGRHITPFWKALTQKGITVGVFDVPFASPVGMTRGFEVCEWWAHDRTTANMHAGPESVRLIMKRATAHPLSAHRFVSSTRDYESRLTEFAAVCSEGARLRGMLAQRLIRETNPQLSIIVFPELHHGGHRLWHTVARDHEAYKQLAGNGSRFEPALREVYRAVDEQIGELIRASNASTVMVFALHGMRPALGFPGFLGPLLCELGFAKIASWGSQTSSERFISFFAATKRRTPARLKKLYYQMTPITAVDTLTRPTMLPTYDWNKTRAFALPTDQYGWIRFNLSGRESRGIVAPQEYDKLCVELEQMLRSLTSADGQLLVENITRTSRNPKDPFDNPLPDLVVHWHDAAFSPALKIKGSKVGAPAINTNATGQHASEGFCIYRGTHELASTQVVDAKELGRLITRSGNL